VGAAPVRTLVLTLSLTFDHRAVDGAPAADYLRAVVGRLQNPLSLLA
jgi:pyruvate dehydrogenase E2 component (dihydrolipoamide acetyltransferase)